MLWLVLLVVVPMALVYWLLGPLTSQFTDLFNLAPLGWGALLLLLWLFAGPR
ncbi:MAG: hypothetical protein ACOVNL_05510 [Prochlorococcaceae cyanobacterium]|jgi:hypothetical protein